MPELGRPDGGVSFKFSSAMGSGSSLQEGGLSAVMNQPLERVLKPSSSPEMRQLVGQLHEELIESLDTTQLDESEPRQARRQVQEAATALIARGNYPVYGELRQRLVYLVTDEVLGLGPIQSLVDDHSVSEIMVNGPETIYVERNGVIIQSDLSFNDDAHVRRVADRILSRIGRRVDEATPMVDARLADGSRVNVTIPPATPKHATITVRKFRQDRYRIEELVEAHTLDTRMAEFLGACVTHKLNILISGGTGSGKTTLLNALSAYIPRTERIITIEDPLELALQQRHVISMEARPADMTGGHAITQRDLLRNALRMRPDRIIVGEVRGSEAFEMMQAMNTGHEGSLCTVHANTPRDALARIENMVLMAGVELPDNAIREQLAAALHLVIQLQRFPDGTRRIVRVSEVTGMEGNTVTMHDLFIFKQEGMSPDGVIEGRYRPTGLRPTFSPILAMQGRELEPSLFIDDEVRR